MEYIKPIIHRMLQCRTHQYGIKSSGLVFLLMAGIYYTYNYYDSSVPYFNLPFYCLLSDSFLCRSLSLQ